MALDYRTGNNTWGHAMHAETMRKVIPAQLLDRLKDKLQNAYRASVMIHSPHSPKLGEDFLWTAATGHTVWARVYDVDPCLDPHDMYKVFVRVAPRKETP